MNDWVTIGYYSPVEITVLKARLEEEGIECFSQLSGRLGYESTLKVQVRETNIEKAEKLLEELGYLSQQISDDKPKSYPKNIDGKRVCPYCGSDDIRLAPFPRLVVLLLVQGHHHPPKKWHCFNCSEDF